MSSLSARASPGFLAWTFPRSRCDAARYGYAYDTARLDKLPEAVERHTGGLNDEWLMAADLIVASPGIALAHPSLSAAADAGIEIVGDIELFCREAQAPIVAITGSNGKSTVTTLVGEMAKAAGLTLVWVAILACLR